MKKNTYLDPELLQEKLSKKLYNHREKLKLTQRSVAYSLGKSESTYQRWEATGKGLTNIFDILKVFRVLDFSVTEIIEILGLPNLKLDEIKNIYSDEDTLKSIKEAGIYSYLRKNCTDIKDITIEKLLDILCEEHHKRYQRKHGC